MSTHPTTIIAQPGSPFIEVLRDFDATPARLFRAWTRPELVVQWLGPYGKTMELIEFDVRSGGSYRYLHRDPDGREFRFRGVFHTVTDDERIIQTFEWEGAPGQVSLESLTFESREDRTRVHTHTVFPSVEARDAAIANGMERGIADSMNRLDELLASQQ
jgi:uncharacterized protein YndB with AHSA1/START domain